MVLSRFCLMTTKYKNLNNLLTRCELILASGSPRRVRLLHEAGINFKQIIPGINESDNGFSNPYDMAMGLARMKAEAIRAHLGNKSIALGCDTIVVIGSTVLGKPHSAEEALDMLSRLSGQKHTVCSAITLLSKDGRNITDYELTDVFFNRIDYTRLQEYVKTGEPLDKAGAYGIQGAGGFLVDRIEGNMDNVIGLPMNLLDKLAGRLMI